MRFLSFLVIITLLAGRAYAEPAPPAQPAAVVGPTSQVDSYTVSGGQAEGFLAGDRVRVTRNGVSICEAIVFTVKAHSAVIAPLGRGRVERGDRVEYVRRKVAPPPDGPRGAFTAPSASFTPVTWKTIGPQQGLLGESWSECLTAHCRILAETNATAALDDMVRALEEDFGVNADYMGVAPQTPVLVYICSPTHPLCDHPRFAPRTGRHKISSGVSLVAEGCVLINVAQQGVPYEKEFLRGTSRHEMNHIFCYLVRTGRDRDNVWSWLTEALAMRIEDTVHPAGRQYRVASLTSTLASQRDLDMRRSALRGIGQMYARVSGTSTLHIFHDVLASFVIFLEQRYGPSVVSRLVQASRGKDVSDAFREVCGKTHDELEVEWRKFYGLPAEEDKQLQDCHEAPRGSGRTKGAE